MLSLQDNISLIFDQHVEELVTYLGHCATTRTSYDASMKKHAHLFEPQKSTDKIAKVLARDLYLENLETSILKSRELYALLRPDPKKLEFLVRACQAFANPQLMMPLRLSVTFAASGLVYEIPCAKDIASFDAVLAACFYTGCVAGIQTELSPASIVSKYVEKGAELLSITFSERPKTAKASAIPDGNSTPSICATSDADDSPHKPGHAWRDIGYL